MKPLFPEASGTESSKHLGEKTMCYTNNFIKQKRADKFLAHFVKSTEGDANLQMYISREDSYEEDSPENRNKDLF